MSHKPLELKEGAFLISDAHYSPRRPELLEFLKAIKKKELQPTQLILMGDIFDALFGLIPQTYQVNQEVIDLINELSLELEVLYLEGNHDFNVANIFPSSQVFTIQQQPILLMKESKKILLAHGDFMGSKSYKIYTSIMRSPLALSILNIINSTFNNYILKHLYHYLEKKKDCTEIKNFEHIISSRLEEKFECAYFIEGHFHQNKFLKINFFNYINLAAFACNQRYFIVKSSHKELLVEKIFSKER